MGSKRGPWTTEGVTPNIILSTSDDEDLSLSSEHSDWFWRWADVRTERPVSGTSDIIGELATLETQEAFDMS